MVQSTTTHVANNLFQSLWHELKFLEKPITMYEFGDRERTHGSLILNLHKAVWVHRKISPWLWIPFLRRNIDRMTSSQELYVTYTNFVLNNTVIYILNPFHRLVTACSLITAIAELCVDLGYPEALSYSPKIFEVFFNTVLKDDFEEHGGWKGVEEYILKQSYLKWYRCKELLRSSQNVKEKLQQELNFAKYIETMARNSTKVYFSPVDSKQNEVESDEKCRLLTSKVMN
ncbi:hypothetical protein NPIL_299621 [Nephila pilipes]|uniref:Uncharacterized protein n=1 Tax=Nephila pilipes TaxID=299642 RepID=A0A8X6T6Z9_NEPPI|nr:hypothetical protein NPIL_299621 [Nephila pilipes]